MKENQRSTKSRNSVKKALKNVFNVKLLPYELRDMFKILHGINRDLIGPHVTKMCKSVDMFGIIRPIVVAKLDFNGLSGMYVLDGTHLFNACIRNRQDIPYKEIEIRDAQHLIECLAMLNNSSKPWKLTDFVLSWSYLYKDYERLMTYHKQYDLELTSVAGILANSVNVFSSIRIIKDGTFRIKNEQQGAKILSMVADLVAIFPKYERVQYKNLVNGYVHFVRTNLSYYKHDAFIKKLNKEITSAHTAAVSTYTAAEFFYNVYNH